MALIPTPTPTLVTAEGTEKPWLIVAPIPAAYWVCLANGDMERFFKSGPHANWEGAYGVYIWAERWWCC